MNITEVSKQSGLPASTLRFYEEKGLIQSIGRDGLKRLFSPTVLEQLSLIALGRSASLSLDEIGEMFTPDGPKIDRGKLLEKADELEQKINDLSAMRDGLRHAAACPEANQLDCPIFLRHLRIAARNRNRQTNRLKG